MTDFKNLGNVDSNPLPGNCTTRDLENNVLDFKVMTVK